jgi:hypothetical protein
MFWIKSYCQDPKQDACARKQQQTQQMFIPDELLPNGDYLTPTGKESTECPNLKTCPVWKNFRINTKMIWIKGCCQRPKMNVCVRKQHAAAGESVPENLLPNGQTL